ncbi:MAG TPA: ABC transporter ATP-binding protein [Eoetvoesiella sp.]|jgi:branched-chain amino acid transport system ATP-binding protein|uniref:ABC transporter ATP-binding protein n=1 Tax=Eoetvoesiella sp. TaxID=1966355 RepID=UPI002B69D1DD|nr:ABC transporter ATP-binding protein [Eoetvoesiella sp.]HWK60261.1 ABC transporter ATP-binding protein [Eoetvoesiella sp.]
MSILRVEHLSKAYGGLKVTDDVSFTLKPGERLAIIGPNGAGKTTLVSQIAGALQSDGGRIFMADDNVTSWPGYRRVGHGLVRTFQISKLAPDIPVLDQLALAIHQRDGSIGNMWRHKNSYGAVLDEALAILRDLGLSRAAQRTPSEMAYGDQRLVEVALALALKPRVLLLDEPMAGVPKSEAQLILDALERLPADLAVVIIEHDMELVFRFAHRILVLANGAVLADGAPAEIRGNEVVRAVYLGKGGQA